MTRQTTASARKRSNGGGSRATSGKGVAMDGPDRRRLILDLAAALFAQRGVAATTVRDIGDAAGILSGSLYHHFASKEAMVEEIMLDFLDWLVARYEAVDNPAASPSARFTRLVEVSFEAIDQYPNACAMYQNEIRLLETLPQAAVLRAKSRRLQRYWTDVIDAGMGSGEFRADINPLSLYRFVRDALWFTVRWPRHDTSAAELSRDFVTIFLHGAGRMAEGGDQPAPSGMPA